MPMARKLRVQIFISLLFLLTYAALAFPQEAKEATQEHTPPPSGEVIPLPEMVVQEEPERGYRAKEAATATKTDAPIMETPVSIQVIPQQVLKDQQTTRLDQAVKNVSGVYSSSLFQGQSGDEFVIRGFRNNNIVYRDGFRLDNTIAVFSCVCPHFVGVPRAACCPCVAAALADKPPVAPLLLLRRDASE